MSNWYTRRLSGAQHKSGPPPAAPPPPPPPPPQQPTPHTQRPQSSMDDSRCPSCSSTNYMAPQGTQNKRCFDCGYPIVQAGSGIGATTTDGTVHKAVQVESGGYNPTQIIGKVE